MTRRGLGQDERVHAQGTAGTYGGRSAEARRIERRLRLLAAAREVWGTDGWAAVTMRGVCGRAGLVDRYFYESFSDRDALLGTVWDQERDALISRAVSYTHLTLPTNREV